MERVTTPAGITYTYEKSGYGPPLVLVHGSLTNHITAWALVKPLLERDFTLYAVDRRGRGETTPTEGHTIPEEAADLVVLIESIGEPVFLLGHSFGALISLAATAMVPDRVHKLALYEPPLPSTNFDGFAHLNSLAEAGNYDTMVQDFMRDTIRVPTAELELLRASPVWQWLVADGPAAVREWPALIAYNFDATKFRSLAMPVLLITGSESPSHLWATDDLAAVLPNRRVAIIAGEGHGATFTAAPEFAEIVTSFFREQ